MKLPRLMAFARPDSPLRVKLHYVLFGTLWIAGSDWWVGWRMGEPVGIWKIGLFKGLVFIFATAGMLYVLIKRLGRRHVAVEAELQVSQQRLALALQAANQGLYDLNVQTGETVVNDTYAAMLGYDPKTFRETNAAWHDRLHPDDREKVYQVYTDYVAGRLDEYRVEFRQRTATGDWRWILSLGRLVERDDQGRPLRMLGTHTDITDRKSAEGRIVDTLGFVRTILNSSPIGVLVYGSDGRAVTVNEAAAEMAGTNVAGLLRQNFREMESWREYGLLAAAELALATGKRLCTKARFKAVSAVRVGSRPGWCRSPTRTRPTCC